MSNVRPFLKELRDQSVEPYDCMYNSKTASYNAHEYIKTKVRKNSIKAVKKKNSILCNQQTKNSQSQ